MKKSMTAILSLTLASAMIIPAFAASNEIPALISEAPTTLTAETADNGLGNYTIQINGKETDINTCIMVPVRQTAEALGFKVNWNNGSISINDGSMQANATIGVDSYILTPSVDGVLGTSAPFSFGTAPFVSDGVTYVPLGLFDALLGSKNNAIKISGNKIVIQTSGDNDTQIPNPFVDCATISDAKEIAGFIAITPQTLPDGYSQKSIRATKDGMVEIIYVNGEENLRFRQAKGSEDISGDFNEYKENKTMEIIGRQVSIKGNSGKINVATWTEGGFSYAITADHLDSSAISDMISSIEAAVIPSDDSIGGKEVSIPNPFIDCKTIDAAAKIAGFNVTLPEKMPEGYAQKLIQAIEDDMIQVFYENGENEITIRKANGNEDISGDYNKYEEDKTATVNDLKVVTKGNNGTVNVATWTDGEFTYSITANLGKVGLDASVIKDMVGNIR